MESVAGRPDQIGPGSRVTLHFSLALGNGELIDSNFGQQPVSFVVGDGNLLPGFEQALAGFRPGRKRNVRVPAARAFGEFNVDNVQTYSRSRFPADLVLEKGLMLAFADLGSYEQTGVVKDFDAEQVIIDFNHPLAGRDIEFSVEILSVEPAKGEAL
ncbi:MAG: peptidylprolyl isomerase [Pseudomonadales bacterium]|nr:peptidylprolyl isomerase [Pseudomonadales bacterium]